MRRGPTPFQEVAIFPDYHKMSSSIETVTAEAVTSRLNRMSNSAREPYDQSMPTNSISARPSLFKLPTPFTIAGSNWNTAT